MDADQTATRESKQEAAKSDAEFVRSWMDAIELSSKEEKKWRERAGEAVARNLRARRVRITEDELKAAWDASRSDSQPWVITLTFASRIGTYEPSK